MSLERWIAMVVGLLLLCLAAVTVRRARARGDGVVTALGVFATAWGGALALFALPLIDYTATPASVWLMVYGSVATFIAGSMLAEWRFRNVAHVAPAERQRPDARRLCFAWALFAVLGLVGFAAFVHAVDVVVGWRAIFESPETVRGIQTSSVTFMDAYGPWKLLSYFNQVAFVLWTLGIRERSFTGRWRVAWMLGPLSLAPFLFTGDRTLIVAALLWAVGFQMMYKPPTNLRRLALIAASGLAVLILIFSFLGGRVGKTIDGQPDVAASLTTRSFDSVALPYLYATGNIPAFSGMIDDPLRPDTNGELTILSVIKLLHGFNLWGQPPETVGAFYPIPFQTFNNFSWLGIFYSDFGFLGVLLLPLLFAFVSTAVVIRAIRKRTLLSVWAASLLLYCIVFTVDGYKFFDTLVTEYLLLGLVVVPFIRADLGPREIYRRLESKVRTEPGKAVAVTVTAMAVFAVAAAGLFFGGSDRSLDRSGPALRSTMKAAAGLATETRNDGIYPTSEALASQLRVNNPTIHYVGLYSADQIPGDPETIGVFTDKGRLILKARASDDSILIFDSASGSEFRKQPGNTRHDEKPQRGNY